jgi:hypothetical protein
MKDIKRNAKSSFTKSLRQSWSPLTSFKWSFMFQSTPSIDKHWVLKALLKNWFISHKFQFQVFFLILCYYSLLFFQLMKKMGKDKGHFHQRRIICNDKLAHSLEGIFVHVCFFFFLHYIIIFFVIWRRITPAKILVRTGEHQLICMWVWVSCIPRCVRMCCS